jgi:hAT family protein
MQFLGDFSSTSDKYTGSFHHIQPPGSRPVFSMLTKNSVIITINLINRPFTHGPLVSFLNPLTRYVECFLDGFLLVLNPCISYKGMLENYASDLDLLDYFRKAKSLLKTHYALCYAKTMPHSLNNDTDTTSTVPTAVDGSFFKVNFTLRYKKKDCLLCNELDEYFKLSHEDFNACNPLQWWIGWQAQFPSLFCLAQDLLIIPNIFSFSK